MNGLSICRTSCCALWPVLSPSFSLSFLALPTFVSCITPLSSLSHHLPDSIQLRHRLQMERPPSQWPWQVETLVRGLLAATVSHDMNACAIARPLSGPMAPVAQQWAHSRGLAIQLLYRFCTCSTMVQGHVKPEPLGAAHTVVATQRAPEGGGGGRWAQPVQPAVQQLFGEQALLWFLREHLWLFPQGEQ